ncbi:MAG: translational GTPase TypA [Planctomycetaceae bacterium]
MQVVRNVAIVAHVDHGKTTLVDQLLRQSGAWRSNQEVGELVMDSNEIERERGITILAKNTAIYWKGAKINIVDTPGHADFGGEVERVLGMVDGVLLLVDAFDGPMAQTRFVLRKAFERGLKPIVVVNKVDRPNARPVEVLDDIVSLFCDLDVADHQLDFRTIYASGREGWAARSLTDERTGMGPLLDLILAEIPAPRGDPAGLLQMAVAAVDYDSYVGRVAIGRVRQGMLRKGSPIGISGRDGVLRKDRPERILVFEHLKKKEVEEVSAGEICALVGLERVEIGETITDPDDPRPLPVIPIEEPTIAVLFTINSSPLVGQEGSIVQGRKIRERLYRETECDVALRVEDTDSADTLKVSGRGVLHLGILIEKLRREGYEFSVGKPQVIMHGDEEPLEKAFIDAPVDCSGTVVSMLVKRKGELVAVVNRGGHVRQEFLIPSRGLIGLRTKLLSATRGEAIMQTLFAGYGAWRGPIPGRSMGVQISMEAGKAVPYALFGLKDRGAFFVRPGDPIYEGMIVGEHSRGDDIVVNPCRTKRLTNIRASGSDENVILSTPKVFSVEEALEFIEDDEFVEVTPKSIRLRKRVLLESERRKMARTAREE